MPAPETMYDEAIELQETGQIEEAIKKLHELVDAHPNYALAHHALSAYYSKLEKHDEAVEHGAKVCELESNDPFSFVAMSLVCQKAGRMAEAEQALMQSRQIPPLPEEP